MLELHVLPLKPLAVVFLTGFNDFNQLESMARPGDPYSQGVTYARRHSSWFRFLELASGPSRLIDYLTFRYITKELYHARLEVLRDPEAFARYKRSVVTVALDNMKRSAVRCEQEKVPCYFFLQPFRQDDPVMAEVYGEFRLAAAKGLPGKMWYFDLSPQFEKNEYFVDPVHMSAEGQGLLANVMAEKILANPPSDSMSR